MRFGLFGSAHAKRGGPAVDSGVGFREFVDGNVEAESLGFCSTFLVEHDFTGFGQISATLNLLTFIAARPKTLRLGTAVIVLAEQAATLDLLSQGRLDFGIGMGYRYREFARFCLPMEEAEGRFDEALEIILRSWTSEEPWSHPADSIRTVAVKGYNLLLDQYASVEEIGERIALFRAEVEKQGRPFDPTTVAVTRSLNVVRTEAELRAAHEARIAEKLPALRDAGAEYVLLNSAGGRPSMRRFAHEIRPAFADEPALSPA